MLTCPNCSSTEKQVKAGMENEAQRYKCQVCKRRYTLTDRRPTYTSEMRRYAIELHREGIGVREIGRRLGINYQNIGNWVRRESAIPDTESSVHAIEEETPLPQSLPTLRKRSTISDVAAHAGVSVTSVSNYLNGKQHLSELTRSRIATAIDALHFTPSALVRAIRERRTGIIGVIAFGLCNLDTDSDISLTPAILSGINTAADQTGYDILLFSGWPHRERFRTGLDFLNGHIDGLLWVAPDLVAPAMERAAAGGLPIMGLLTRHVPEGCGYINVENVDGVAAMVAHLVGLGHRRIAFCGSKHSSNARDRRDGYRRGLAEAQLIWDASLEVIRENIGDKELLSRTLDQWLSLDQPPTAIIANNDFCALDIIRMLKSRGLHVPTDIAVTGFDDIPLAEIFDNGLTTIHQPFRRMGRLGLERLVALIEGASDDQCCVNLPVELIVRGSTVL